MYELITIHYVKFTNHVSNHNFLVTSTDNFKITTPKWLVTSMGPYDFINTWIEKISLVVSFTCLKPSKSWSTSNKLAKNYCR